MRTKLASTSAIALALVLGAPALAQDAPPPLQDQQLQDRLTQPGTARPETVVTPGVTDPAAPGAADVLEDPDAPGVATDPATDPAAPGVATDPATDPAADPTTPGVATDPATDPAAPGVATDPATDPAAPDVATDPATDPAAPDVAIDPATDPAAPGVAADPAAEPVVVGDVEHRISMDEIEDVLDAIGVEDRDEFAGTIIRARTDDGQKVAMLVGPEGFERGEDAAAEVAEFGAIEGELRDAGFEEVQQAIGWTVVQGRLDGHTLFALAIDPGAQPPEAIQAEAGNGAIDAEALRSRLGDAGIDAGDEIEVKLFRASTDDGHTIFLAIGPEGMEAGGSVALSDDEIRGKLEEAGLGDVEQVEEGVHFVRGSYEGSAVIAVAGDALDAGARAMQ